jgi:hypothetical protein
MTIAILNENLGLCFPISAPSVLILFLRRGTRRARIAAPLRLKNLENYLGSLYYESTPIYSRSRGDR